MQQNKPTLVVGATPNPQRYAFIATNMLLDHHHDVVLFGIKKGEIRGLEIRNEWPENEVIDTITLYLGPQNQPQYYDRILASKPKRIIFNPGTENQELKKIAEEIGIECTYACTLVLLQTNQY